MKISKPFKLRSQGAPFKMMGSSPFNQDEEKKVSSSKPKEKKESSSKPKENKPKKEKQEGFGVKASDANKKETFNTNLELDKTIKNEKKNVEAPKEEIAPIQKGGGDNALSELGSIGAKTAGKKIIKKGLQKLGAKALGRAVPIAGMVMGAKDVFDGYGELSKTEHGKQIIKDARMMPGKM